MNDVLKYNKNYAITIIGVMVEIKKKFYYTMIRYNNGKIINNSIKKVIFNMFLII